MWYYTVRMSEDRSPALKPDSMACFTFRHLNSLCPCKARQWSVGWPLETIFDSELCSGWCPSPVWKSTTWHKPKLCQSVLIIISTGNQRAVFSTMTWPVFTPWYRRGHWDHKDGAQQALITIALKRKLTLKNSTSETTLPLKTAFHNTQCHNHQG